MKKLIATSVCIALLLSVTACGESTTGNNNETTTTPQNTTSPDVTPTTEEGNTETPGNNNGGESNSELEDLLESVVDEANENLEGYDTIAPFLPPWEGAPPFDPGVMGMSAEQFENYAVGVVHQQAAINTIPFELILIETENAENAESVAEIVAENYDTEKWICVFPRTVATMRIGEFVLVVAAEKVQSEAIAEAFSEVMGEPAEVNMFHELSDEDMDELLEGAGEGDGGGFGFGGPADIGDIGDLNGNGVSAE
jgi:hypothetical protein